MKLVKLALATAGIMAMAGCSTVKPTVAEGVMPPAKPDKTWAAGVTEPRVYDGLNYRIYVPRGVGMFEKVPLVFFFHGAGERGADNALQLVHGVPQIVAHTMKRGIKAIVVAPQCPKAAQWVDTPFATIEHPMKSEPSVNMTKAMKLLDAIVDEFPIDEKRIVVTGISMGGYGTWDISSRIPERFAAAMPICGGGDVAAGAKLVNLPIRTVHGDADTAVPVENSRRMVGAIRAAGGTKIWYREIPKAGHGVWIRTYNDPEMLDWLFSQSR